MWFVWLLGVLTSANAVTAAYATCRSVDNAPWIGVATGHKKVSPRVAWTERHLAIQSKPGASFRIVKLPLDQHDYIKQAIVTRDDIIVLNGAGELFEIKAGMVARKLAQRIIENDRFYRLAHDRGHVVATGQDLVGQLKRGKWRRFQTRIISFAERTWPRPPAWHRDIQCRLCLRPRRHRSLQPR